MKQTLLHVFSRMAIVALTDAQASKLNVSPWIPSGPSLDLKIAKPEGTKLYSVKIASTYKTGDTVEIESLKSNRGEYNFLAEFNFLALNEKLKTEIAQNEINSTANIIGAIKDADKMTANQLIATVMVVKASRKERWGTYQNQRAGRSITSQSAFQSGLGNASDQG